MNKDKIATYYSNARELVKQNQPKEARAYVVAILNAALQTYSAAKSILTKAKTQAFLDKWIAVSRELYSDGVTDFVLDCFALPHNSSQQKPATEPKKPILMPKKPAVAPCELPKSDEADIAGFIDEIEQTQGWCSEIFAKNKNAIVEILVLGGSQIVSGTGFIISSNGYLLTNDHVVFNEETGSYFPKAKMKFVGGKESYNIKILFSDKKADVALCGFDPQQVPSFSVIKRISDYSKLMTGADCIVIGNTFGQGLSPKTGNVGYVNNIEGDLVYSVLTNPGESGAPVLNRRGECIGIHKSKTSSINGREATGMSNATPMNTINELLQKWTSVNDINL